ncbi:MAG: hypothetical protein AAGU73_03060 [Actinomycetota bacterium]
MDERYYIIGALALLLGLLAIYVIASIGRYRRAVRRSRMPQLVADTECEAKYLAEDDSISAAFTAPAAEPAAPSVEPEPVVAPVVKVAGAAPAAAVPIVRPALEPDSLEQPDEPHRAAVVPEPIPMAADIPVMDELTRLMLSLESSAPAPARVSESALLPPEAHVRDAVSPAPVAARPASPALARPARPVAVVASVPPAGAENSAVAPRPAAVIGSPATERSDSVPGYALVAPVELHFAGGQGRVGVRPGTRSYAEFQRLAGIMLGDLRAARER